MVHPCRRHVCHSRRGLHPGPGMDPITPWLINKGKVIKSGAALELSSIPRRWKEFTMVHRRRLYPDHRLDTVFTLAIVSSLSSSSPPPSLEHHLESLLVSFCFVLLYSV